MLKLKLIFGLLCFKLATLAVCASVLYVNVNNSVPIPPFQSWDTAATNIQDAIDAATNGDQILVTNGVYQSGGKVMAGDLTNRVALNKMVTVQSVNGPLVTSILGNGATNGTAAIRCAWLTNGATLTGFTLMRGATRNSGAIFDLQAGGGVWCASSNALVSRCLIASNSASQYGGAIYQGTATACLIVSNGVQSGSGASFQSALNNCTVVSNAVSGVVNPLTMTNCILYFNNGFPSSNYQLGPNFLFSHCCTVPALNGVGNFTNPPQLFADGVHLSSNSPCLGTGVNIGAGTDLFGTSWSNPPSVGCAEWPAAALIGAAQLKLTGNPAGFVIGNFALQSSSPCTFTWYKDGELLPDNGRFSSIQTANLTAAGAELADAGTYQVVVSNAFGAVTSSPVTLVVHCVNATGINPTPPYLTWDTAATNIQDAIAASVAGDIILVTKGIYNNGGKSIDGVITNRVSIDKAVLVQSVSGPNVTVIQGAQDSISTNGPGAIRCVWMTNSAILSGFTLRGGATRMETTSPNSSMKGGGILGNSNNAVAYGCIIATNFAADSGGGANTVTLNHCLVTGNNAVGSGIPGAGVANAGSGGGAANCNLNECLIAANIASQSNGGGADHCNLKNCFVGQNSSYLNGGGVNSGTLVNCTVTANTSSGYSSGYGAAVYGAALTNCIVFSNFSRISYLNTNYANCTMTYCCAYPLPSGTGNIGVNPQLLGDNLHLAATSPCIGAGLSNVVSDVDIDDQPWNNPPAIGCDEWQPAPVIGIQPGFQVGVPAHGLTFNALAAGQIPITYFWSKGGSLLQDDGHYNQSNTSSLIVNSFGPEDAGTYQVVVSNAYGMATSAVTQVTIHAVNLTGSNPAIPYDTWTTAATNIQDAIEAATAGDIVLVTNGIYATGGKVVDGDLTNRVVLNKPIIVISVNGWNQTIIQGVWDPISTNGPEAVRCAYLTNGAVLNGFTLQNGATRATGESSIGGPLKSGGGAWCSSTNEIVCNCLFSNNNAMYGGGTSYGTVNNSVIINNQAVQFGGGTFYTMLNNCTVVNNATVLQGAGTYGGIVKNSIVVNNYDYGNITVDNYSRSLLLGGIPTFFNSCTSPTAGLGGANNINADPQFLDLFHIAVTSPCRGAASSLYLTGVDLDGEPWINPPSMGCDEVVIDDLTGPLTARITFYSTNTLVNFPLAFSGYYTGRAATTIWTFGDGITATNRGTGTSHRWANAGDYPVSFTVYNNDQPTGVSANITVHVEPLQAPQIQAMKWQTNGFQFQFTAQTNASYVIQYTTNLLSPVSWQTLQTIYYSQGGNIQINDPVTTNAARFYRVSATSP